MLHFLEMRDMIASLPTSTTGLKPQFTDNETNTIVGYPHDILSAICGEDTNTVLACPWFHPKPYAAENLDSE